MTAQVGRSMSYRKPVPVYVPEPSSSPTTPPRALEVEESNVDVPPVCRSLFITVFNHT
jgi:hypothetical protein